MAYGVTTGGAFAPEIGLTPLGLRIVRPTKPGDDVAAKREALLRPKIIGDFLRQYDGAAFPPGQIAKNVLLERGVPAERVDDVLALVVEGADAVGVFKDISGKRYVDLALQNREPASLDAGDTSGRVTLKSSTPPALSLSPAVHVNLEIHIAADASSQTIEEIFKNMRRYVLNSNDGTSAEE